MSEIAGDELLTFNGIDGATGGYAIEPMTVSELAESVEGAAAPANFSELVARHQRKTEGHLGVTAGVDPKKLDQTGWGILFARDADPGIREALDDLIALRRDQAGDRFRIFAGDDGYIPGESKDDFLYRHDVGYGPVDPEQMPYYLLIVGSPATIPYEFQVSLDVQHAVGRIDFATLDEYASYAGSVAAAERGEVKRARQMSFFGPANDGDRATLLSSEALIEPLVEHLGRSQPGWRIEATVGEKARKSRLLEILGGEAALLFAASHGMVFPPGHRRQRSAQGALLCQDWPGPLAWKSGDPIPADYYLAGDDIESAGSMRGLVGFFFACFGVGTSRSQVLADSVRELAPEPFVASLPQRMLANPRGGALAVIGQFERAWSYSFQWRGGRGQTTVFEAALQRLLDGYPVGAAVEYFNERHAELAVDLQAARERAARGYEVNPRRFGELWTAHRDARSYTVLGDPAVRLAVTE